MATKTQEYRIKFTQDGAQKVQRDTEQLDSTFSNLSATLKGVAVGAAASLGTFATVNAIQVASEYETLRVRLEALFNDVDRGREAFDRFKDVAATTPFSVRDVVEAGASLKAFGVNAEANIKVVADLAAFMGTTIPEAASAMGRAFSAGAGAADIFRERGVLNLIKVNNGIEDLTKLTLPEFREAMLKTFNDPDSGIAGATDKLSNTFAGAVSNAGDAVDNLAALIGEKLLPAATDATKEFAGFTGALTHLLENFDDNEFRARIENSSLSLQVFTGVLDVSREALDKFLELESALSDVSPAEGIRQLFGGISEELQTVTEADREFKALTKQMEALDQELQDSEEAFEDVGDATAYAAEQARKYAAAAREAASASFARQVREAADNANEAAQEMQPLVGGFKDVGLATGETTEFMKEWGDVVRNLPTVERAAAIEITPETANSWDLFRSQIDGVSRSLESGVFDAIEDGKPLLSSLAEAFEDMLKRMAASLASRAIVFGFLNLLAGGSAGALAAFTGLGGSSGNIASQFFGFGGNLSVGGGGLAPSLPPGGGSTINNYYIQANDAKSFERFLIEDGGAEAVERARATLV